MSHTPRCSGKRERKEGRYVSRLIVLGGNGIEIRCVNAWPVQNNPVPPYVSSPTRCVHAWSMWRPHGVGCDQRTVYHAVHALRRAWQILVTVEGVARVDVQAVQPDGRTRCMKEPDISRTVMTTTINTTATVRPLRAQSNN